MKTILNLMAVLFSLSFAAAANAACQGEAQVIATVASAKANAGKCVVSLKAPKHFKSSAVCPLDIDRVLRSPVNVPLSEGQSCEATVGQEVSGVIVLENGDLSFEL